MKYLYTSNATQEYKAKGTKNFYKFQAVQTLTGWVGVLETTDSLAPLLIEENPGIVEVDKKFYDEIIKKKRENPNLKVIQTSIDPTKPVHAEYKEKAVDAEFVEVEEIEVRPIEEKPKSKPRKKAK
tara:strand:+ start:1133 stop:1510 length:378 start_codon:yes stop_codon:yes gene_type:complete